MSEELTRTLIALTVIVAFFAIVLVILLGLVDVSDPTLAKVVGTLVGYVTALMNPIIMRYFKETPG